MTFPEALKNPSPKILRQFAAGWLVFFLLLGARAFWRGHHRAAAVLTGVAVLGPLLAWLAPAGFRLVFRIWMTAAFPIGWAISQISLALIFFGAVTPLAFLLRLTGRDRLGRRRKSAATSYWKIKTRPESVNRYFRPY